MSLAGAEHALFSGSRSASPPVSADSKAKENHSNSSVIERATLGLDVTAFYDSPRLSDLQLRLAARNGSAKVLAHRLVLSASSTYFASLFSGPWKATEVNGSAEVEITSDEKLAHLQLFVEYLYGREVVLDLASAHPLLRLADFYGVDALSSVCMGYLERVLHPEPTRCFTLFLAEEGGPQMLPSQPKLLALCTEVLARSFADASAHEHFLRCPVELLASVIERDDLSYETGEVEVLHALLRWAEADAPARTEALAELISLVRWPAMSGELLADIEESHPLLAAEAAVGPLRGYLLEALKYRAASATRKLALTQSADVSEASARRYRPRTPNMVRLQGDGKFCWHLKNFSKLAADERIYSPPFCFSGIAFMLLFFPRGNQQREFASLYVSVADKTALPASWRRELHFSLCVVDQKESLCSVIKSTNGVLSNTVLDWGFTELMPLPTLHSSSHGYILDDTLQFAIQFERITEGSVSGRSSCESTPSSQHHQGLDLQLSNMRLATN